MSVVIFVLLVAAVILVVRLIFETETSLRILKYVASALVAGYALYATVTDFKQEENDKSGKNVKRLSEWGRLGIAFLLITALTSILVDVFKDLKERADTERKAAQEAEKRSQDLEDIKRILDGLESARNELRDQSSKIGETQKSLNGAARSLSDTALKTDFLFHETADSLGYLDIMMEVLFDPAEIKNELGQGLLSDSRNEGQTADIVRANYSLFRRRILESVALCVFGFSKGSQQKAVFYFGPDHVANFFFDPKFDVGPKGMACYVTYRALPYRSSGFTRYRDLNGATWGFSMIPSSDLVKISWVMLNAGKSDLEMKDHVIALVAEDDEDASKRSELFGRHSIVGQLESPGSGGFFVPSFFWSGKVQIPVGFFK